MWELTVPDLAQFNGRVPENQLEIHDLIIFDFNTLLFQKALHRSRRFEVMPPCKQAVAVHHPVRGHGVIVVHGIHCPSHHARTHLGSQIGCNRPIACRSSLRNKANYFIHIIKKTVGFGFRLLSHVTSNQIESLKINEMEAFK